MAPPLISFLIVSAALQASPCGRISLQHAVFHRPVRGLEALFRDQKINTYQMDK
jgi:hypothetical protein